MPRRATKYSAGYDFKCPIDIQLYPNIVYDIDTGIHLEDGDMKDIHCMVLSARSSMRRRYGMDIVGLIDADYRDSIHALVKVTGECTLKSGDRFMQGVILRYFTLPNEIPPTEERKGGIGSTGN